MNAFSKIDMAEVTRLTRAGKLAEALAMLQGNTGSPVAQAGSKSEASAFTRRMMRQAPTVGLAAAPISESARQAGPGAANGLATDKAASLRGMVETMRVFRGRLPKMRSFSGLGEGVNSTTVPVPAGARFEERTFSNEVGTRSYKVYVPSGYTGQPLPVVVMLHGCTQDPDDFAAGTRMNEVAEEQTFLVAYPHQPKSANVKKCWNWFNVGDQQRQGGEPSLIAGVALQVVEEFSADATRIYVAGLSAGGAAAAVLATTHPDLFAAVGVHSGLACGAARDVPSAFAAMSGTGAFPPRGAGSAVPTIVFHGDADRTVHVVNADQVAAQAMPEAALTEVELRRETPDGMAYTRTVHFDDAGREVLERWVLHGAGHAWSGGSLNGSYADPRGPDASREMIRFFLQHLNDRPGTRNKLRS